MDMICKVVGNAAANTWMAASEFAKRSGSKRTLHKSTLAVALALSAPLGTAWAGETCTLTNGQRGVLDDKGDCIAEAPIFFTPLFFAGGGDDSGQPSNVAIGQGAQAVWFRAIAIGENAYANSESPSGFNPGSTAIGAGARAETWNTTALGSDAIASGARAVALGRRASAAMPNSVALGSNSTAMNDGSMSLGFASVANGDNAVALGTSANATHLGSVALGYLSTTNADNTVSVGSDTLKRKIVNVAAGTLAATSTDVVNGSQLFATNANVTSNTTAIANLDGRITVNEGDITTIKGQISDIDSGSIGLVKQNATTNAITVAADKAGTSVSFAGTSGARSLSGVAAGALDTDATNFSQLKSTAGSIATAIGGGSVVNADGTISAPSFSVGGTTVNSIGDAITNIDGRVIINEGDITTIKGQIGEIGNGTIGLVKQDATTKQITVAADEAGTSVNLAGTDGARALSGVADGDLSNTSDEAVNGSQLFETNERVVAVEGDITTLSTDLTALGNQVINIDGRVSTIEGDLNDGTIGIVRQDPVSGAISVASASGGTVVDFAGTDGARVLSGVANGTDDQDAATIAQLKASGLVDPNDGRALGALVYDDLTLERATLGGTNGTVIANVANGLIVVGSRDAVNGGQLATIRDDLQTRISGVSDRVTTIESGIADGSIGSGVVDDNGGNPISNVGAGVADSDAANVGQMHRMHQQAVTESNAYTDTRFDVLQDDFNQRFEVMDGRIDRMAALSGAYSGMAMNTAGLEGKNRVGAGIGAQGGKAALAVGYQRLVGTMNNVSVSIGGAFSGSEKSVSAGAGFSW